MDLLKTLIDFRCSNDVTGSHNYRHCCVIFRELKSSFKPDIIWFESCIRSEHVAQDTTQTLCSCRRNGNRQTTESKQENECFYHGCTHLECD